MTDDDWIAATILKLGALSTANAFAVKGEGRLTWTFRWGSKDILGGT